MTKTQTARLMAFSTLLNTSDFFTPAAISSIMSIVMTNARKSGGRPGTNVIRNFSKIDQICMIVLYNEHVSLGMREDLS